MNEDRTKDAEETQGRKVSPAAVHADAHLSAHYLRGKGYTLWQANEPGMWAVYRDEYSQAEYCSDLGLFELAKRIGFKKEASPNA